MTTSILFGIVLSAVGAEEKGKASPVVRIAVTFAGASAEDVEQRIAVPIEHTINGLPGLARMAAVCSEGRASILLLAEPAADGEKLLAAVRKRLELVSKLLPVEAEPPMAELVEDEPFPPKVKVRQVPRLEIRVDRDKLALFGIPMSEVAAKIAAIQKKRPTKKVVEELQELTVGKTDQPVPLRAVADVHLVTGPSHRVRLWPPEPDERSTEKPQRRPKKPTE